MQNVHTRQQTKASYSPKEVAHALNVSESSLKRWCDQGLIQMHRTSGGHRRIKKSDVLAFVRSRKVPLARPEFLGLPGRAGEETLTESHACSALVQAYRQGDIDSVIGLGLALYARGHAISDICDRVITVSLTEIGHQWETGALEIYQERNACSMTHELLSELGRLIPKPAKNAPFAMGASVDLDPYTIAVRMGELVLKDLGWNAQSIGANVPTQSIIAAIEQRRPQLIWLSISYVHDHHALIENMTTLYSCAQKHNVDVIVGGQGITEDLRKQLAFTGYCDSFSRFVPLAQSLVKKAY